MNNKLCIKCKLTKNITEFYIDKLDNNRLLHSYCIDCVRQCNKIYRKNHRQKTKFYNKFYYKLNKKRILKQHKIYNEKHKAEIREQTKYYRLLHKKEVKIQRKKYQINNREKRNKQVKNRLKLDMNFKIRKNLSSRIYMALKKTKKSKSTIKLVGCSIDQLKKHLERQFKSGMSWSNYGKWHIDHIIPCCAFDLRKKSEQKKCFHYTNLQPLWAKENYTKRIKDNLFRK